VFCKVFNNNKNFKKIAKIVTEKTRQMLELCIVELPREFAKGWHFKTEPIETVVFLFGISENSVFPKQLSFGR
jgi:hypothetical protein